MNFILYVGKLTQKHLKYHELYPVCQPFTETAGVEKTISQSEDASGTILGVERGISPHYYSSVRNQLGIL